LKDSRAAECGISQITQGAVRFFVFCGQLEDFLMAKKPTYEELERRVEELEKEAIEFKRIEEALLENEEKHRILVEGSIDGIAIVQGLEMKFVNQALLKMFGFQSEKEMMGHKFTEFVSPEDKELMKERAIDRERGLEAPKRYFFQALRKDGSKFDAKLSVSNISYKGNIARQGIVRDISEQKRAEDALRKSKANLLALLENTSDYILLSDSNGFPVMFNSAYARIMKEALGVDMKPGLKPHKLLPDKEAMVFWDDLHRRVLSGEKFRVEYTHEFGEKDVRHLEMSFHPIIEEGKVIGFSELTRDITQRKQTEEALKKAHEELERRVEERTAELARVNEQLNQEIEQHKQAEKRLKDSEELYRSVVEQASEGIFLYDYSTEEILETNKAFQDMLGYTNKEMSKLTPYDFIAHEKEDIDSNIHRVVKEKYYFIGERKYRSKDGALLDVEASASLISFGGKKVLCVVLRDITDRKRAEEALRESEELYSNILESVSDGILTMDSNFCYTHWNRAMEEISKTPRDQIVGDQRLPWEIFPHLAEQGVDEMMRDAMGGKITHREDIPYHLEDGTSGFSSETFLPLRRADGEIRGIVGVVREVSERKEAEKALQEAHDDLELQVEKRTADLGKAINLLKKEIKERKRGEEQIRASLKEKVVLLREIHHRVRNNLQVISSLLELARTRTNNKEASDLLLESHGRIHTMALIHSQLYQSDRFDKIDMQRHLQQLVTNLSRLYGNDKFVTPVIREADIFLSLTQAIPCAIALNELISNAFKHAYQKGEKGTVKVLMEETPDGKLRVTVKDQGIGIPKEIDVYETGSLGLKLTRNLVLHQLNGQFQITRNNGTEALIEFPVSE